MSTPGAARSWRLPLAQLAAAVWLGVVGCIAFVAAPAAFAALPERALAGAVVARLFAFEAHGTLLLGLGLIMLLRGSLPLRGAALAWGGLLAALAATVLGYFGLQEPLAAAKAAHGSASGAYLKLHGLSMLAYAVKLGGWLLLTLALTRRLTSELAAAAPADG